MVIYLLENQKFVDNKIFRTGSSATFLILSGLTLFRSYQQKYFFVHGHDSKCFAGSEDLYDIKKFMMDLSIRHRQLVAVGRKYGWSSKTLFSLGSVADLVSPRSLVIALITIYQTQRSQWCDAPYSHRIRWRLTVRLMANGSLHTGSVGRIRVTFLGFDRLT